MILVENKFNIGDECYTGYRQPVKYKCPICEGNGVFTHNGYSVKCSNCCGTGNLHNSRQFILVVGKVKINKVVATFNGEEVMVKYKVSAIDTNCNIVGLATKYREFACALLLMPVITDFLGDW